MRIVLRALFLGIVGLPILILGRLPAVELPHIKMENGVGQLVVKGSPFLIMGGELGNSSAGTAAAADSIVPKLAAMHVNTILVPVAWEQIEPKEGSFDFNVLDHWMETARRCNMRLVLLWFGSWKNAFSNYAPSWVKSDPKRFPRADSVDGRPLEILSTLSAESRRCDGRAFAALMHHLREMDSQQQTVLMVQVENEVGYLGRGRDRSREANRLFHGRVPEILVRTLAAKRLQLSPELAAHFNEHGQNWSEVFGDAADEVFMAWNYAAYLESVARAGKSEYALPMYVNAQLPAPLERAGEYPSGGPHPYYLEVWRATAPSIDFYSPDIYWPNFEYWVQEYEVPGNAIFIPEARMESAPYNAFYAYGQARAFGFSPFAIDSLNLPEKGDDPKPDMTRVYELLDSMRDLLPAAQAAGSTRGLVLHTTSPRPTQTVDLGGYLFEATLSRSWPARTILADDGAMLILEASPGEFYIAGSGLTVTFARDPDVDAGVAGIESAEQVSRASGQWTTERRLNGDQTNQGRQLLLDAHRPHIYRVRLYSILSEHYRPGPASEGDRRAVNEWIRTPGHFDEVIDFDKIARDPEHPERLLPALDCGDHLHPLSLLAPTVEPGPKIAITFDDLPAHGSLPPGETRMELISKIIAALREAHVPPTYGFVNGARLEQQPAEDAVLQAWLAAGNPLANHSWSHMNLNQHSLEDFEQDVVRNEPVLMNWTKDENWRWFRYPFLAVGNTPEKRAGFRNFLRKRDYKIAAVTMSFGDYLWNEPYARCRAKADPSAITTLEDSYLAAADQSIGYYRSISQTLYQRDIPYVLLLHVGAFDAEMLRRLLQLYRARGFQFVTLPEAERDDFYRSVTKLDLAAGSETLEEAMSARQLSLPSRTDFASQLDSLCR